MRAFRKTTNHYLTAVIQFDRLTTELCTTFADVGGNQKGVQNKTAAESELPASKGASGTSTVNKPVARNAQGRCYLTP